MQPARQQSSTADVTIQRCPWNTANRNGRDLCPGLWPRDAQKQKQMRKTDSQSTKWWLLSWFLPRRIKLGDAGVVAEGNSWALWRVSFRATFVRLDKSACDACMWHACYASPCTMIRIALRTMVNLDMTKERDILRRLDTSLSVN